MNLNAALRANAAFTNLAAADLDALAYAMLEANHADGHVFISEGSGADSVYLLLDGAIAITRQGGHVSLGTLGPGGFFGAVALVDDGPRSATCTGLGRTRVASISTSAFALLFNTHAPLALAVQEALATQLAADFRRSAARLEGAIGR